MKNRILEGFRDGLPICLGYFTVSFAFGMMAKQSGLTILQAVILSVTNVTSAGQFAGLSLIAASASYFEMALTQLIINMRYFLMSCSLSQNLDGSVTILDRFLMSYGITDEIFGVSACRKEKVTADYFFALVAISVFGWTFGTFMGVVSGSILPDHVVSALGIALYGMFIAIIIPPAKQNRVILTAIVITMCASWLFSVIPVIKNISSGFKIIILTITIAGGAAYLHPVEEEVNE